MKRVRYRKTILNPRPKRRPRIQPKGRSSKLLIKLLWISLAHSRTNERMVRTSPRLNMIHSLSSLFHSKLRILSYIMLIIISSGIWWYFTDIAIMFGNYGKIHTYTDIGLSMIMIFGFPLFLIALYHKGMLFWKKTEQLSEKWRKFFFSKWTRTVMDWKFENDAQWTVPQWMKKWKISEINDKTPFSKTNILGTIGGTLGTILSGCSCCGLTLASYFGLLPLMSLLPYDGLEIKILWTLGLVYALYDILKNLETCSWKK